MAVLKVMSMIYTILLMIVMSMVFMIDLMT
jgi:hypothetical protein